LFDTPRRSLAPPFGCRGERRKCGGDLSGYCGAPCVVAGIAPS
jgi:hypothetical protein